MVVAQYGRCDGSYHREKGFVGHSLDTSSQFSEERIWKYILIHGILKVILV